MPIDCKKILGLTTALWLGSSGLSAQVLTAGAPVPLPEEMISGDDRHPAVLALPEGGFALAANTPTSHRTALLTFAVTNPEAAEVLRNWEQGHHIPLDHWLVPSAEGFFSVALDQADLFIPNRVLASRFDSQSGTEIETGLLINPEGAFPTAYDIAQLAGGDLLAIWNEIQRSADGPIPLGLFAQRVAPDGDLVGKVVRLSPGSFAQPRLAASATGGYLVAWMDPDDGSVRARAFDGQHTGGVAQLVVTPEEAASRIALSALPNGTFLLVWSETDPADPSMIFARRIHPSGIPFAEKIELSMPSDSTKITPRVATDRFGRSWVVWNERAAGAPGDIYVRILGADGVPGGMLRLPEVEMPDQAEPVVDIDADGLAVVAWIERHPMGFDKIQARTVRASAECPASDTVLCLHGGRFRAEVVWTDFAGNSGAGRVLPFQSEDSGIFWFFDAKIWELMVKVVDGCSFNGFYWVFSAATTDVAFELVVTDTETGLQKTYTNELGVAAPANTDTAALMSCPLGPP